MSPGECRRKCELAVNVLNYSAAKNATSDLRHAPALGTAMPVRLTKQPASARSGLRPESDYSPPRLVIAGSLPLVTNLAPTGP